MKRTTNRFGTTEGWQDGCSSLRIFQGEDLCNCISNLSIAYQNRMTQQA
jgi:hypothetical protein